MTDWRREKAPPGASKRRDHKGQAQYHHPSGWVVHHCGGFSAHTPWYLDHPDQPGLVFTHNGMGWRHLGEAKAAVEAIVEGRLQVTDHRCAPGVLRVLTPDELAEDVQRSGGLRGWRAA